MTCEMCKFYNPYTESDRGDCRRHCPVLISMACGEDGQWEFAQPMVKKGDYCGDWEAGEATKLTNEGDFINKQLMELAEISGLGFTRFNNFSEKERIEYILGAAHTKIQDLLKQVNQQD